MKRTYKRFLSLMLVFLLVLSNVPMMAFAEETALDESSNANTFTEGNDGTVSGEGTESAPALPDATVTIKDPVTLKAGEYSVYDGSLTEGTEDLPLQVVMNFKANDTLEECQAGDYKDWLCDFYLTFGGFEGRLAATDSYLAGNYGTFGWIVIPTDEIIVEAGVEYPVVSTVVPGLDYEDICGSVKEFIAALYIAPEILEAHPDFNVTLNLKMTDSENPENVLTIGEPAVFTADDLVGMPNATVEVLDSMILSADQYTVWNGSGLSDGAKDLPLQAVMNFKANDTLEQAQKGGYGDWLCDFYLTFDGMAGESIPGDGSYLIGKYGEDGDYANLGWIAIPADGMTVEKGVEYPIVSNYDSNLTYENICDYVKEFTAALYVNPDVLKANPDLTVTLKLKMTNPEDETDILTVGKPAVYDVPELLGYPDATVTIKDPVTLKADEYTVYDGGLAEGTDDLPLQVVMNFKANDTLAEAQASAYGKWKCDFYLTFENMAGDSISGDGSYLAGNYGDYGWIVIPTDGLTVEDGEEYPIVSNYDDNLTYENICDYVKDFTAALYVDPATLRANPDMTVTLKLKMTNPEDENDVIVIGEPAVYTAEQLSPMPNATVTVLDPVILPAGEYDVWNGSGLTDGTGALPLQAVMNFKANDTLEECQAGDYSDWLCDFYLTFDGLVEDKVSGAGSYLAGRYGEAGEYDYLGWIAIPADTIEVQEGVEYPIVSNYDANLTYENICDYVQEFTAALYVNPEVLKANPDMTVTLTLKMTNPENEEDTISVGEEAVYTAPELLAASGYVAMNADTKVFYENLTVANEEAKAGETVVLLQDIEVRRLDVYETFDLNGHEVKATYVCSYGNIVDNSESNAGLLKSDNIFLRNDNTQLPVNTADGYKFVEVRGFNYRYLDADQKYVFQPLFEEAANNLLLSGYDVSGVDIQVNVSWVNSKGEPRNQSFSYNDEAFLQGYLGSYDPATGKYGKMFGLAFRNITADLTYQVRVISDEGVIFASYATFVEYVEEAATTSEDININAEADQASALVQEGTKLAENASADSLTLTVEEMEVSQSNITLGENEIQKSVDVHIDGIAEDNTVPMLITLKAFAEPGLNEGNLKLYHVENGVPVAMIQVFTLEDVDAHNEFYYDPATGDITMALATFSEIAVVSNTENAWNGEFDYSWYTNAVVAADGEAATEYKIANADQLAAFGAIVGGMDGKTQDSFENKTIKLLSDINLGDKESENNPDIIFYPIGYYNSEGTYEKTNTIITSGFKTFKGTFDGNGHTISNFYQNTWEMKGDNNYYDATLQYYRDGMGLFGKVYGGTVKNLTVDNFSSDGEYTTTGVIAAYADCGATFENIAITNCNPRVYNIGNGGIVGCVGWYANEDTTDKVTFKNITVDNTNKISALWGSYDVACGGLVGQYYPTSGQSNAIDNAGINFENCHVSAQMDVYNDVCANYQYYAYRYTGMMIGSIRENLPADANGHIYPNMDDITAKDCTVHFGDWNDYYYCELVANTQASYTHDYQMSRLEQVSSVDVNNLTVTSLEGITTAIPSGRVNYVVVKEKNADGTWKHGSGSEFATCYHFVDSKVWGHDAAGTETVNGIEGVLKEDKQLVYREFNQLFTGYGWGVTSKGLTDFEGIQNMDIEQGDYEESVEKFKSVNDNETSYEADKPILIGNLFQYVDNGIEIKNDKVQVAVSPADEESTVSGTYVSAEANTDGTVDWTQGTLTFSGAGAATITITDYYFCTPTTITVNITERKAAEKFDLVFENTNKYLYRVGNQNTVALGSLFTAMKDVEIGTVSVKVETVIGASGTYTSNATWTNGTIQFSGTGVVKVTITDNDYCTPTELYLEVVDATNITSATAGTGKNFVLLKDVTYSDTYLYYKNSTVYGNGFKLDITGADHSDLKDTSDTNSNKNAYCNIWMVDSTFNNVNVVGSVYPEVGMTADSDYGNAAIRTEGDCYIVNSKVSNCRVPLRVQGNTTVIDSIIDGGRYANIELRSGTLTLDGVTTINTVRKGSDGTTDVIGFGIVIHSEAANASISVIGDGLKQYNWAGENKHKTILSKEANLSNAYKLIFNANNNDTIYFDYNSDRYVNTGILCLCADIDIDVVTGLDDRYCQKVSGYDAWVLTYDNNEHTEWFNESVSKETVLYVPEQYPVIPTYSGNEAQTVEFTKGETYYFDTSVLTAEKSGQMLEISSVVMNGTTYNYDEKIAITEGGVYEVVYTVVDPYNYNADASSKTTVNHNTSITVTAIAKDAEILAPKFTFIDQNGNKYEATTVKVGDKTYVMPNVTAADPTTNSMSSINIGSASISGTTVYFPVATGYTVRSGSNFNRYYPLFNGINITDYTIAGDTTGTTYTTSGNYTSLVGSSGTKFIIPPNGKQTNCGDYVKTDGQAGNAAGNSDSGWQGAGYSTSYGGTYLKSGNTNASSGADSNGYERIVWVEYSFNAGNGNVYYYRIGYHCNKEAAQSGCFTSDALVTLADGSQKRIDELEFTDKILVWDFFTGDYAEKDISILVNHGEGMYNIANLKFDDGTVLRIIADHGVFDYDLNKFVYITVDNMDEYVGHRFVQYNANGDYNIVTLTEAYKTEELTSAWSVSSAETSNAFASGLLTVAPPEDFYNWIEMDGKLTYDAEQFAKDVETYGLYTYEDFKDYVTYEQFIDWNGAYLKIPVEKGLLTFEYILELIDLYVKWMPQ